MAIKRRIKPRVRENLVLERGLRYNGKTYAIDLCDYHVEQLVQLFFKSANRSIYKRRLTINNYIGTRDYRYCYEFTKSKTVLKCEFCNGKNLKDFE